jgi:hypothetical protein
MLLSAVPASLHGLCAQAALLLTVWDDTRPRLDAPGARKPERPELAVLPEVEELRREEERADVG